MYTIYYITLYRSTIRVFIYSVAEQTRTLSHQNYNENEQTPSAKYNIIQYHHIRLRTSEMNKSFFIIFFHLRRKLVFYRLFVENFY